MSYSPTIIAASLDDAELRKSIDKLVNHVDDQLHYMVASTKVNVKSINDALKTIGNVDTKLGSTGSKDGGAAKQVKAQEELGEATRKTTSEIKRQGKDVDMTFGQIAAALSQARREVSNFNTSRASGILPNSEAYRRYEQALARIVEYNDKLKQSALALADSNAKAFAFDAKRTVSDLTAVDDRYKKLVRWYTVLEKEDQRRIAREDKETQKRIANAEKERAAKEKMIESARKAEQKYQDATLKSTFKGVLTLPTNNIDELRYKIERITALAATLKKEGLIDDAQFNKANAAAAKLNEQLNKQLATEKEVKAVQSQQAQPQVKSARDSYIAFMQGYKEQANQLTQLIQNEENRLVQAQQSRVTALGQQIDQNKTKIQELREQMQQLAQEEKNAPTRYGVKAGYRFAIQQTNDEINKLIAKNKELEAEQQKVASTDPLKQQNATLDELHAKREKVLNIMRDETTTNNKIAESQQQVTQSAQRYTDEIRRQAQAIRESKQWREKGVATVGNSVVYNAETNTSFTNKQKQALGTLEEQLLRIQQQQAAEQQRIAASTQETANAEQKVVSEAERRLQIEGSMQETLRKSREIMREMEAQKGGSVATFTPQLESLNKLSTRLKDLRKQYNEMTFGERFGAEGQKIAQNIRIVTRETQKLQAQLARPASLKEALGHPEKTLDDIAYKMQRLSSYRSGINFETQKNEIEQVNKKYAALQKKMNEVMAKNNSLANSNNVLANSWRYMRNRMAFYLTVGTGASFVRDLARVRSEYEMNEKALGVLIGSAERGTRIFNELSNMALVSPYTLIELSSAAKQLTAYDIAAKDVVDTTRRLADISAAVGIPVERLTYALGQVKAYGHLTSQDARQFLNAGVPLVKELADRYSELEGRLVSTADVYDRMKKHAVSYNDVISVLTSMTDEGGRFFDYQAKMAETLKVRLANLSLAYNNMLNEIGKAEGGTINMGVKGLTVLLKHWRGIERIIGTVVVALGAYKAASLLAASTGASAALANAKAWVTTAREIKSAGQAVTYFSMAAKSVPVAGWVTAIASLLSYFWLFNNSADETKQKLEDIATAFEGIRKETINLYAEAISTDSFGTEMTKLRDMLELAETELGITIPVKLEDVDKHNIEQKLKEAKQFIDDYVNFSQTFTETAVDTRFGVSFEDFGKETRSVYTSIVESVNTVKVALQGLADTGKASKQELAILKDLDIKPKDGEATLAFFQRLIASYEKLGLISQKEERPWYDFSDQAWNPMLAAEKKQEDALDRLGIKNKTVFENLLNDVQNYYDQAGIATGQFIQQIDRLAERIDLKKIPKERKTLLFEVAINQFAAQNNWNEFAISYAKMVANKKFGTSIIISPKSKAETKSELIQWQRELQAEADKRKITLTVAFAKDQTEAGYASQALSEYKSALDDVATLERKVSVGTASAYALQKAKDAAENARKAAILAGADLASLEKKTTKTGGSKKDLLGEAVQKNVQYINEIRKAYEDFKKDGLNATDAVEAATKHFGKSLARNNKELAKYGIQGLTGEQFATMNLQQVRDYFQNMINGAQGSAKAVEILEKEVKNIDAELIKFNQKAIDDSLNNELSKLKDEYELAVAIDADPELGNVFADMMGINTETLPHTVKEYADMYTTYLNKFLAANKSDLQFGEGELFGLTYDDIAAFQKQFEEGTLNEAWFKEIKKAFDAISGMRKKDLEDTEKWKSGLIEKYGGLQAKLTKIFKDDLQNQINTVKTFGTEQQKSDAVRLRLMVDATDDPARLAEINAQIATIVKNITDNNPVALKLVQASSNEAGKETSKAYWEDFKDSDLYTMTFEDMANNSTRAIKVIIGQLDELKNKVKEDPASMKALIKSLEDAENELITRNPFKGVVSSLKEWKNAAKETKDAQARLAIANAGVAKAQEDVDATAEGTKERLEAEQKLNIAMGVQKTALNDVLNAENKQTKAQSKLKKSLTALKEANEGVSNTFSAVSQMFRAWGDDDTADTIDAINEGFTVMSSVISAVIVVMEVLKTSNVWLLAISAALGVIVGLVSFLGGQNNKRITKKVEESELAVKALENTYRQLEHTASNAYGAITSGAKKALQANKELQLIELQRQLTLEKSRDSKDRDESKILDLEGQIIDLKNEIHDATQEIINDLLGISSAGEGIESMVEVMIEAFRNGEDAMEAFSEKWDEMIDNMTLKLIVTTYMQKAWDELMSRMQEKQDEMMKSSSDAKAAAQKEVDRISEMSDEELGKELYKHLVIFGKVAEVAVEGTVVQSEIDAYRKAAQAALTAATTTLDDASFDYTKWSLDYMNTEGREFMDRYAQMLKDSLGEWYTYGENAENNLSSLQQGISGITEDTAGAIESYLNGVSQQVYYQSSLLEQIRDTVVGIDFDVSLGVQSQMLLQLQNSYQTQQAILSMLEGWSTPSGQAIRVEVL